MGKNKFKVSGGVAFGIITILFGMIGLSAPLMVIVRGIISWEGVASFIGICVLALVALVFFGIPSFLLINQMLDYVKVDGTRFWVRWGFRTKYTADCEDLRKVYCYKDKGYRNVVRYNISITFEGREPLQIPYMQKNFKRLAKYLYEMHEAGVISSNVIKPKDKKTLLKYSKGEFGAAKKKKKSKSNNKNSVTYKFNHDDARTYTTYIRVAKIRDKAFLKILLPLLIWALTVFTCLILVARLHYSEITVPALIISFLLIIPIVIIMCKKLKKFSGEVRFFNKDAVFEVVQEKVYMDGKEVIITVNTVSGLFNINTSKLEGYIVEPDNTKEFRAFLDANEIPYDEFGDKISYDEFGNEILEE